MMRRMIMVSVALAWMCAAADARGNEIRVGTSFVGVAPVTKVLRIAGPGIGTSLDATLGVLPYLDVGLRYTLGAFLQDSVDSAGNEKEPIYDHGASATASLSIVNGVDGGWLEGPGDIAGDLFLDLGLGYHMVGRENTFGLDVALGYRFYPGANSFLAPLFRFVTAFDTSQGHAAYVAFGLALGYDLGWLLGGDDSADDDAGVVDRPGWNPGGFGTTRLGRTEPRWSVGDGAEVDTDRLHHVGDVHLGVPREVAGRPDLNAPEPRP